jgi:hypothetical protein
VVTRQQITQESLVESDAGGRFGTEGSVQSFSPRLLEQFPFSSSTVVSGFSATSVRSASEGGHYIVLKNALNIEKVGEPIRNRTEHAVAPVIATERERAGRVKGAQAASLNLASEPLTRPSAPAKWGAERRKLYAEKNTIDLGRSGFKSDRQICDSISPLFGLRGGPDENQQVGRFSDRDALRDEMSPGLVFGPCDLPEMGRHCRRSRG